MGVLTFLNREMIMFTPFSPRCSKTSGRRVIVVSSILLVLFLLPGQAIGFSAEKADLDMKPGAERDAKCLKCHSKDKTKMLQDGAAWELSSPDPP